MTKKTVTPIKAPSAEAVYAAGTIMARMPDWRRMIKPLMDGAAAEFKRQGKIVPDLPIALDEFGRYCRMLGKEIKQAQAEQAQRTIAPVPATAAEPARDGAREVGPRRTGETASSSPRPRGRPRKPVQHD